MKMGPFLIICMISVSMLSPAVFPNSIDDYIEQELLTRQVPGAAYAMIDRGKVSMNAYGIANLETGTKTQTDTVFEVASVIKPFTAIAIMQLVESGKIALDGSIRDYIDNAPDTWASITIRHLLSHTAGFGERFFESGESPPLEVSTRQHFNRIVAAPMLFSPGEKASYSDDGFFLLGMIIEKASGQKYRDYMKEHIFAPAGMNATRIEDRLEIVKNHVSEYVLSHGRIVHDRRLWQHELPSFYGLWTTVGDMAKWDRSLDEGLLLKRETLRSMWAPTQLKNGNPAIVDGFPYGLGWFVLELRGHQIVAHPGYYGSVVLKLPDDGLTVVLFTNLATTKETKGSYQVEMAARIAALARPDLTSALAPPWVPAPQSQTNQFKQK